MRCPTCDGSGIIHHEQYHGLHDLWVMSYCEECGGSGVVSCCEPQTNPLGDGTTPEATQDTEPPAKSHPLGTR